jgi:hypothetical protein
MTRVASFFIWGRDMTTIPFRNGSSNESLPRPLNRQEQQKLMQNKLYPFVPDLRKVTTVCGVDGLAVVQ